MRALILPASLLTLAACNYQPQPSDATKAADEFVRICDALAKSGQKLPKAVVDACNIAHDLKPVVADVVDAADGSAGGSK